MNFITFIIFFINSPSKHMIHKWEYQRHWDIHPGNQGASEMCMSLHTLQWINKTNENIPGTRHDNFFKYVPIQKWDIKKPQPSDHHPRVPKYRLQQTEDHIWSICTSLHRHYKQYKIDNCRGNCTNTSKQTGWLLFYLPSHRGTSPRFHMDRTTHKWSSHTESKLTDH